MLINIIKSLMILSAGVIIGYFVFTEKPTQSPDNIESNVASIQSVMSTQKPEVIPPREIIKPKITVGESIDKETLSKLDDLIDSQQLKIEDLQAKLDQQIALNNQLKAKSTETEELNGLQSLTMEDFEEKMKNQFFDRFKGFAIELTGKRLESIQKEFDKDTGKMEWSNEYENNINSYIQNNDPERLHFVDEMNCNSNMCRLKVNSSQPNKWNRLFLSLTQQAWYNSITLKENSEDPNTFIYFITKPKSES